MTAQLAEGTRGRQRARRLSIKSKVLLPVAVVLMAGFAVYACFSLDAVERYVYGRTDRSAATFASVAERSLRLAMVQGDPAPVFRLLREISKLPDVQRIRVVNYEGKAWMSAGRPFRSNTPEVALLRREAARTGNTVGRMGPDWVYRAVRPIQGGPRCVSCHEDRPYLGYLEVDLRASETHRQLALSRQRLLLTGGATLLLVGLALLVTLHVLVSSPLSHLRAAMKRVENGDLSARASISSGDELEDLGRSFNHMVEEIEAKNQLLIRSAKLASIGLLAAGVAHEINNPVATISMSAERLLEMETCPAKRKFLQAVVEESDRVAGIVGELLSLEPRGSATMGPCNLDAAVRKALAGLARDAERNGVRVQLDLRLQGCQVRGQEDPLAQAFANMIDNAIRAMPNGGDLKITGRCEGGAAVVEIADTGTGIAPEHLDKVFDPFFTTREVGDGYGLGLSVTHKIVEEHGGNISVTSGPGGTTFTVRLPVGEDGVNGGQADPHPAG